jgi:hypothetical protein
MHYPHVTEIVRAGRASPPFPRTQRELVELSLRAHPNKPVPPVIEPERPRGIFR